MATWGHLLVGCTDPTIAWTWLVTFIFHLPLLAHPFLLSHCPYPNKRTTQALDEARSIARRPMAQSLKDEREEIVVRFHLAKGDADRAVAERVHRVDHA